MKEQNLKNHKKYVPGYHIIAFGILIILLFATGYSFYEAFKEHFLVRIYGILFLMTIYLVIIYFFSRIFALKAQDRAIRAEESLRHFIMTGKPFDSRLGIKQIIALRFASDDEFIELSKKAAEGNLSPDEIKREINQWREDNYRA